MAIYLTEATFVDWQSLEIRTDTVEIRPGAPPVLRGGPPPAAELAPGDEIVGCRGRLVTRSFACGHHHVYSALALGMPPPARVPRDFADILQLVWWHLDRCLDLEMVEASALAVALDALRSGVTFVIDHHSSPNAISGSLRTLARALDRVGIGHLLCYEMSDRDGPAVREEGIAETDCFLAEGGQGLVGLHASFTVGEQLLRRAGELMEKHDSGIHVHVAEDPVDQRVTRNRFGQSVGARLNDAGVLGSGKSIAAHCLHLDGEERALMAHARCWIAQKVESNRNDAGGLLRSKGLEARVMLGTDGMHTDMLRAAQATYLVEQGRGVMTPAEAYRRLRLVHRYLAAGGFRGDGEDNLVILDYPARTEITPENFLSHLLFGLRACHVQSVIAGGRFVMRDRRITTVDEAEILEHTREMARRLWSAMESRRG